MHTNGSSRSPRKGEINLKITLLDTSVVMYIENEKLFELKSKEYRDGIKITETR